MESPAENPRPYLSVIVPVYNEEENISPLWEELRGVLHATGGSWEVIFVDDGSDDGTWSRLESVLTDLDLDEGGVKLLRLARNYGQTIALKAGIDAAGGDIIVTMDGDLQNDPGDIPRLLEEVEKGADVVSGRRRKRKDPLISRRIPSWFGNRIVSWQTGVKLHDFGCSLKAYRREIVKGIRLYGEMHRLMPALAGWMGANIVEVDVNHRRRMAGNSKYHLGRVFAVILDIISLRFFSDYATRPTHVIGMWGIFSILLSGLAFLVLLFMKFRMGVDMTGNPFLIISVLLVIVGVQLIALGLLGEISVRTYYETQAKAPYRVKETREF